MNRAIDLALKGAGKTSPNPMVGAVVVKGDAVVGEGFHARAGEAHAETKALAEAGAEAPGADLYVTLEPCCHEGRTPPCVDAIVRAGISRVFVGARDPNPQVDGKGMEVLRRAGIEVTEGVLGDRCLRINEAYNKFAKTGMPFVTVKVALTLDGKIAAGSGHSKWITNARCREYVHELRALSDAVMVGGGTVRKDDPKLTARIDGFEGTGPRAVVVDEVLDLPAEANIFARPGGELILITTEAASTSRIERAESLGHEVIVCRTEGRGLVDLAQALAELGKRGVVSVLLEGGGLMFASFMRAKMIDRLVACIAPKLVGAGGADFLPGVSIDAMDNAIDLKDVRQASFGDNVVVEGYPNW